MYARLVSYAAARLCHKELNTAAIAIANSNTVILIITVIRTFYYNVYFKVLHTEWAKTSLLYKCIV